MIRKKGQEELVGFAMIIILVAVILLIFLGISLNRNRSQNTETSEVDNFMQATLQYTTQCQDNFGYMNVKDLIFLCDSNSASKCIDGNSSCNVLNSTLKWLLNQSWIVENGSSVKGYQFNVTSNTRQISSIKAGNFTINSKGTSQNFARGGEAIEILMNVYS